MLASAVPAFLSVNADIGQYPGRNIRAGQWGAAEPLTACWAEAQQKEDQL